MSGTKTGGRSRPGSIKSDALEDAATRGAEVGVDTLAGEHEVRKVIETTKTVKVEFVFIIHRFFLGL